MNNSPTTFDHFLRSSAIFPIRLYQFARPAIHQILLSIFGFQSQCRFGESCSDYTIRMIQSNGILRGSLAGGRRILQCHTISLQRTSKHL